MGLAMLRPAMAVPVLRVPGSNTAYCNKQRTTNQHPAHGSAPDARVLQIPPPTTHVISVVLAAQEAGAADQAACHVRHHRPVQVRHDHHVELVRPRHQLHAAVVYDHVVVLDVWVLLGHAPRRLQEQPVRQLPAHTHTCCYFVCLYHNYSGICTIRVSQLFGYANYSDLEVRIGWVNITLNKYSLLFGPKNSGI